tara:strand:+ start:433 stop:732 length:300 start_codon:yes stop_codon:yes gene_type:complete
MKESKPSQLVDAVVVVVVVVVVKEEVLSWAVSLFETACRASSSRCRRWTTLAAEYALVPLPPVHAAFPPLILLPSAACARAEVVASPSSARCGFNSASV